MSHQRPHSVYQLENYAQRVNYAATCILSWKGESSRAFDTCFEMYDGAAVVVALMRRAKENVALDKAIRSFCGSGYGAWEATAAKYAVVATNNLSELARMLRDQKGADVDPASVPAAGADATMMLPL